jgi:transcriptional regulator of acetoin/glycerol metabolism
MNHHLLIKARPLLGYTVKDVRDGLLMAALERCRGNVMAVSILLGISQRTCFRRVEALSRDQAFRAWLQDQRD